MIGLEECLNRTTRNMTINCLRRRIVASTTASIDRSETKLKIKLQKEYLSLNQSITGGMRKRVHRLTYPMVPFLAVMSCGSPCRLYSCRRHRLAAAMSSGLFHVGLSFSETTR